MIAGAGNRIADDLRAAGREESKGRKDIPMDRRRQVLFVDKPPPDDIAGVLRHDIRQHLFTQGRPKAVCANQQISPQRLAIRKMRSDATGILRVLIDTPAKMVMSGRDKRAQDTMDPVP